MSEPATAFWVERRALQRLIEALEVRGFRIAGPVARDGALAFEEIRDVSDLATDRRDVQSPGRYRLEPDPLRRGALSPWVVSVSHDEARRTCEAAIRDYDPCISCATHFLRLEIERG